MAHAPSIARHVKAAGILERHECTPVDAPGLDGLWHVTDSGTGSGRVHVTSATRCDCPDHNFRGNVCKHITAVIRAEAELVAYPLTVDDRFQSWLAQQDQAATTFSDEQLVWLTRIKDHLATSLAIAPDDFELEPFVGHGGFGRATDP